MSNTHASEKFAAEFPLPGGVEQYFDTLVTILRSVREKQVSLDDFAQWMSAEFPSTSGAAALNGYIATINRLGYWSQHEGRLRLEAEGLEFLRAVEADAVAARNQLAEKKYREVLGYDVLLKFLATGARSLEAVRAHLNQTLPVSWESKNQAMFRVNWLRSLGYVVRNGSTYELTSLGRDALLRLDVDLPPPPPPPPPRPQQSLLEQEAEKLGERLEAAAVAGGDGREFEEQSAAAFRFLGFDTQIIGGAGNPDVLATAAMGDNSYRVLVEAKSRSGGKVNQNDVNFLALAQHRQQAHADYCVIVGKDFSEGNLLTFAVNHQACLITTSELRDLLAAHARSTIPLDVLSRLFLRPGFLDEAAQTEVLTYSETKLGALQLARKVYETILRHQGLEGRLNEHSLYFILHHEHPLAAVAQAVRFLKSELVDAIGETDQGLFVRLAPSALEGRLRQISLAFQSPPPPG